MASGYTTLTDLRTNIGRFHERTRFDGFEVALESHDNADIEVASQTGVPGGTTGWHSHPGPVFGLLTSDQFAWPLWTREYGGAMPRTRGTRAAMACRVAAASGLFALIACTDRAVVGPPPPPPPTVTSVVVTPRELTLERQGQFQLAATAFDQYGHPLPHQTIYWATNAIQVASVDQQGNVVGISQGLATIYAHTEGVLDSARVAVLEPQVVATVHIAQSDSIVADVSICSWLPSRAMGMAASSRILFSRGRART
jgi:hypothetical protein